MRKDAVISRAWPSSLIASSREGEDRPEVLRVPASFGCARCCRSAAKLRPGRSQGDAPVKGEGGRGKRGTRGSPSVPESGGVTRRSAEFGRGISRAWRRLGLRGKRWRGRRPRATYSRLLSWKGS
jgi:hypothetical protein